MKIAIMSDFHLGFGSGTERWQESFDNAKQALSLALEKGADAILIAGDIFDSDVPEQETWDKCFEVFSLLRSPHGTPIKVAITRSGSRRELEIPLPVLAIHGTHEYRPKGYTNALEVLQTEGALLFIHAATAMLSRGNERIAIHGMGGIPEGKALDALRRLNPQPVQGAHNLLVIHQSLKDFMPGDDPMVATISISDLPTGFDLIVNGHLHWHSEVSDSSKRVLMPGSTIITQMKKLEAEQQKGICIYDAQSGAVEFFALPRQRRLFYHKLEFKGAKPEEVMERVRETIESDCAQKAELPLLARLRLTGTLAKGYTQGDISFSGIAKDFAGRAVLSLEKDFLSHDFRKKISDLREMQRSKQSIAKMGFSILEKNLAEAGFGRDLDVKRLFELLADDRVEEAFKMLSRRNRNE